MSGKTISAYTDETTAKRINSIAKQEHRKTAAVAGTALKLYAELSSEARGAWWQIQAVGTSEDLEDIRREMTRALLNVKYKLAHRQVMEQMKSEHLDRLETEDDILSAAIDLTNDE
jgi:hypothetical protein